MENKTEKMNPTRQLVYAAVFIALSFLLMCDKEVIEV